MSNILSQIIEDKAAEISLARSNKPLCELKDALHDLPPTRSLSSSLLSHRGGIIAEFKRRSPSKGWIKVGAEADVIVPAYEAAGAAAVSILTDNPYFGGTLDDIVCARRVASLPILRKEFVIDAYQLYEARLAGADACLLIAAAIGAARCHELAEVAHEIGLEVILEIHSAEELDAYSPAVDVLGVNNRDLRTFVTNPAQSETLLSLLPKEPVRISESGLLDPLVARRLLDAGYQGLLIGEAFMKTDHPGQALAQYLHRLTQ